MATLITNWTPTRQITIKSKAWPNKEVRRIDDPVTSRLRPAINNDGSVLHLPYFAENGMPVSPGAENAVVTLRTDVKNGSGDWIRESLIDFGRVNGDAINIRSMNYYNDARTVSSLRVGGQAFANTDLTIWAKKRNPNNNNWVNFTTETGALLYPSFRIAMESAFMDRGSYNTKRISIGGGGMAFIQSRSGKSYMSSMQSHTPSIGETYGLRPLQHLSLTALNTDHSDPHSEFVWELMKDEENNNFIPEVGSRNGGVIPFSVTGSLLFENGQNLVLWSNVNNSYDSVWYVKDSDGRWRIKKNGSRKADYFESSNYTDVIKNPRPLINVQNTLMIHAQTSSDARKVVVSSVNPETAARTEYYRFILPSGYSTLRSAMDKNGDYIAFWNNEARTILIYHWTNDGYILQGEISHWLNGDIQYLEFSEDGSKFIAASLEGYIVYSD